MRWPSLPNSTTSTSSSPAGARSYSPTPATCWSLVTRFLGPYPRIATEINGTEVSVVMTNGAYKYLDKLAVGFDRRGNIIEFLARGQDGYSYWGLHS